ncbi:MULTISPECIES: hypothetical protein [Lactococcus]|uniref:hypothetical protein n=1 Tax=Lactococcus TaxID=1357 RepID=UPI0022E61FD0|nr:hypothetical protein [Lactococcus lactis]
MSYVGSAQQKADKKYRKKIALDSEKKNEQNIKAQYRSAKSYIKNHSTLATIIELQELLESRKALLNEK